MEHARECGVFPMEFADPLLRAVDALARGLQGDAGVEEPLVAELAALGSVNGEAAEPAAEERKPEEQPLTETPTAAAAPTIRIPAAKVDRMLDVVGETVLYDGPARGIATRFPRNVNTMITCALATVGLDRCRARMVAVPGLHVAIAEVLARGRDGSLLSMRKEQPAVGVSGTEMFESQFASIVRAAGLRESLAFV